MLQLLYWYPRFPAADDVIIAGLMPIGLDDDICASYAPMCWRDGLTSMDRSRLLNSTLLLRYDACGTSRCISESSPVDDGDGRNCIWFWWSRLSSAIYWGRSSELDERPNLLKPPFSLDIASTLRGLNSSGKQKIRDLVQLVILMNVDQWTIIYMT